MTAKADIWMAFYVGDHLSATIDLTTRQHGAYLLLMLAAWKAGGTIDGDEASLAAATKLTLREWRADARKLARFFTVADAGWTHARIVEELASARRFSDRQSQNGSRGGRPRKPNHNPDESPSQSPSPSPSVTPVESVSGSAPVPTRAHTQAREIPTQWQPDEAEVAALRKGRPDLVGAFYAQRMADFRDWCRARAITSHDFASTWRAFMRKTHAAETSDGESWESRRKREFEEAIARGLA